MKMLTTEKTHRSINLPIILVKKVEKLIEQGKTLHNNKASFIEDAVRRQIEYIENRDKVPKEFLEIFQYALDQNQKAKMDSQSRSQDETS